MNRAQERPKNKLPEGTFCNSIIIKNQAPGEKIKYLPIGVFPLHPDGPHELTRGKLEEMVSNLNSDLMIDLGHEALWWSGAPAYGWIPRDSFEIRDDGLYAEYPQFTPDADELVENRKYRFLSPAYELEGVDKQGRERGARLWPIGLTNTPYFDTEIDALRNSAADEQTEESTMDPKYTKELKIKLGLAEDATDDQVEEKLDELVGAASETANNPSENNDDPRPGDDPEPTPEEEPEGAVANAILQKLDALEKRINDRDQNDLQARAETLVNSAIQDGKILPADKEVWLNSAVGNFDETKKKLDERKKNSAMPGKMQIPNQENNFEPQRSTTQSLIQNAAEHFKAQGRYPGAPAAAA